MTVQNERPARADSPGGGESTILNGRSKLGVSPNGFLSGGNENFYSKWAILTSHRFYGKLLHFYRTQNTLKS